MYLRNGILGSEEVESDSGKMWFKRAISAWKYASEKSSLHVFLVFLLSRLKSLNFYSLGLGTLVL